jgi:hypothetical protein
MIEIARGSRFQMMGRFLLDGKTHNVAQWQSVQVTLSDYQASAVFAQLNTEVIDPANGVVKVWADDTTAWPVGRARIDARIVDGYGNPYNSEPDYLRIIESMLNPGKTVSPT